MMKLALLLLILEAGCCTYHGKAISCRDAKNMKDLGMDVVCHSDDCGKRP